MREDNDALRPPEGTSATVIHGQTLEDPYAALREVDSPQVRAWLAAQAKLTEDSLDPEWVERFESSLNDRLRAPGFDLPRGVGGRFFLARKGRLLETNERGEERLVADVGEARLVLGGSADGGRVAVATIRAGDDVAVAVVDVATGQVSEPIHIGAALVRESGCVAVSGSSLFACLRDAWSAPVTVAEITEGAPTRVLAEASADVTTRLFLSPDEQWLVLLTHMGERRTEISVASAPAFDDWRTCMQEAEARFDDVLWVDGRFVARTDWQAPLGQIVAVDPATGLGETLIAEGPGPILHVSEAGGRLFIGYLVDVQTRVRVFEPDGTPVGETPGLGIVTQSPMFGSAASRFAALTASDFARPAELLWYDTASNEVLAAMTPGTAR